jgi:hypothetical protein
VETGGPGASLWSFYFEDPEAWGDFDYRREIRLPTARCTRDS